MYDDGSLVTSLSRTDMNESTIEAPPVALMTNSKRSAIGSGALCARACCAYVENIAAPAALLAAKRNISRRESLVRVMSVRSSVKDELGGGRDRVASELRDVARRDRFAIHVVRERRHDIDLFGGGVASEQAAIQLSDVGAQPAVGRRQRR